MTDGSAPRGTAGYAAEAEGLVSHYESIAFPEIHAALLPAPPAMRRASPPSATG